MQLTPAFAIVLTSALLFSTSFDTADAQERTLGVSQSPDSVFDRPVAEILPQLAGAVPTAENGRVGGELVFWGYRLADDRPVYFFACAMLADVDCEARAEAICPAGVTALLARSEQDGRTVSRRCRNVAVAQPGDRRPGCVDTEADAGLIVGLVGCG